MWYFSHYKANAVESETVYNEQISNKSTVAKYIRENMNNSKKPWNSEIVNQIGFDICVAPGHPRFFNEWKQLICSTSKASSTNTLNICSSLKHVSGCEIANNERKKNWLLFSIHNKLINLKAHWSEFSTDLRHLCTQTII